MNRQPVLYGLDIEIDTTIEALDPEVSPIMGVALSGPRVDELFTGPEPLLLAGLDHRLQGLEPGVIVTWDGARFDLPFIAARARVWDTPLHLHLEARPGSDGSFNAMWGPHRHLDARRLYDQAGRGRTRFGRRRAAGSAPPELGSEALHANPASDARLARTLADRRWGVARRSIDRLVAQPGQLVS
ncbi:MAG: hypothetical protein GY745_20785 [Actinomycetia bacterium]|nr:hypothetical protein [Actinomycetes bacterium]MCP3913033.1 hypothetical protein [Actinomycetes bacterium]MCP4087458.1 hypothetical protein [Actinomycetes bacterium]